MNLCVCLKQVPAADAGVMGENGILRREHGARRMNPHDGAALEAALRLRDAAGGRVVVLSMGPITAEIMLREALAVGADEALLLSDSCFAGADVLATAYTLALAIQHFGAFDRILCGAFTTDGGTGHVAGELAARLQLPYLGQVQSVGEHLAVQRLEGYEQDVLLTGPAVLSVLSDAYTLRLPSLSGRLGAGQKPLWRWTAADIDAKPSRCGLRGSATRVKKVVSAIPAAGAAPLRLTSREAALLIGEALAESPRGARHEA